MPAPAATAALEALMSAPEPYRLDEAKTQTFREAMRDAVAWHRQASPFYQGLCARHGFHEDELRTEADLARVPWIFVNTLKHHELLSVPREDVALTLTSSGTTGQKSQICFDEGSLARGLATVDACFGANGVIDPDLVANYLVFAHDPAQAATRGTTYTDNYMTRFTARAEVWYALRWDEGAGDWGFDPAATSAKLEAFAASGRPLRVIGFPAFLHRVLAHRREAGLPPLTFPPGSWVLTGGGWKKNEREAIPKPAFRREVAEALGIPEACQRDGYGLVEHGVPYLECEAHRFHVSHFARAIVRDVETLAPLPDGEAGFLNLLTPYLLSMPAISLLTSDLAVRGAGCPCGRNTATLELMGRLGTRKNKGCAIAATQLLR
ncbi:MAG: acyl-protein synthase [Candidatus Sericytochromatia bacterium]|nr:acyl-protein synthase [Candidatus Sericytochromatia bacterium]